MKPIIIFGKGLFTEIVNQYFSDTPGYEIAGFTLDDAYIEDATYLGKPMLPFSEIEQSHPPDKYDMFISLSYTEMNKLRERKFQEAKAKGYYLRSYISPQCSMMSKYPIGENCFIFEDNTVQPFVKIGDNVILWSGNHIGHHTEIESHNFISSHVVVSGQCRIGPNCFIGVNASIGHGVSLGRENLIGAGSIITKDTGEREVWVPARSTKLEKTSDQFKL
jgi:sugar O-acyltransferase (sialic acid O-acetyltransferase NeuD family)